jgi:hypothetical protein
MNQTTKETRRRSYDAVLPKRAARCRLILETLGNRELTASEITEELVAAGRIPYFNRNYVAPRLTELKEIGILTTVGRRKATRSDATEAVWARAEPSGPTGQTAAAYADNPTEAPISAAPELLAHELAHVATPEDTEHGESWSAASEAIFKKYNELLDTMIPDEPEPILSPHQPGDGRILAMPLRDNVPEPPTDDWQLTTCPVCGAECWQTDTARRILTLEPDVRTACTACALKGLGK